jgi:DtxR family Mn-dependent transcriptional regulator
MEKLSESLENYLRIIYEVQSPKDFARVKDITSRLNVKTASVADALKKLGELGLVEHKKYGYIKLTQPGIHTALKVYQKHQSLLHFLTDVMFMKDTVETDEIACGLEHHLDGELFGKIGELSEFFNENPKIQEAFREYLNEEGQIKGMKLANVKAPADVKIIKLAGSKGQRNKLISSGILPGMVINVEENDTAFEALKIRLRGFTTPISREEAGFIIIEEVETAITE